MAALNAALIADLATSGLDANDINARTAGAPELAAVAANQSSEGYVIPYYDMYGKLLPHYRIKFINQDPKYKQPTGTDQHVYFPPNFFDTLQNLTESTDLPYVIITEGEKKSAQACKEGFPTVGLGGVDSWRSKTIIIPEGTKLTKIGNTEKVKAKLNGNTEIAIGDDPLLAEGFADLVDLILSENLTVIIIYDSDIDSTGATLIKPQVQRAAATLGYELRLKGVRIDRIRQLVLPNGTNTAKVGLDDYLVVHGADELDDLIADTLAKRTAFPRHPSPRSYVDARMQTKLSRREAQKVSLAILSELDARGFRVRSASSNMPYYFNEETHTLMAAPLLQRHGAAFHETSFGEHLYSEFGLSATDSRVITWLASQFTGELPIERAEPKRVIAIPSTRSDCIALQISNGEFALVTPNSGEPLEFHTNGAEGLLFENDQVDPIDQATLRKAFNKQMDKPLKPWWADVIEPMNITNAGKSAKQLATLLFYISPWINRWRGTQLPIEMFVGEAGSGKSSVYSLRLSIMTGRPYLRNIPTDLRDWHASITNAGGLHVIDNVKFTNKDLRQRISDEMCRLTTEPDPHVEMRKLYTTTDQLQIPVNTSFAMTAIQQPFYNSDILQRSAVFEIEAIRDPHDGNWVEHQMEKFGGREAWLAHQLVFLHKFMHAVVNKGAWDTEYKSGHRLIHYEQALLVAAELFDMDDSWIAETLSETSEGILSEADWVLEGLRAFCQDNLRILGDKPFTVSDISDWVSVNEDYSDNQTLNNGRRLGRYIQAHKRTVERLAGIKEIGKYGNRKQYKTNRNLYKDKKP